MNTSNELKYIRAPMLNGCANYNILINRQLKITNPISKVYIRSPWCRYKLLASILEKKEEDSTNKSTKYSKCLIKIL